MFLIIISLLFLLVYCIPDNFDLQITKKNVFNECINYNNYEFCFLLDDKSSLFLSKYVNEISVLTESEILSYSNSDQFDNYIIINILGIILFSNNNNSTESLKSVTYLNHANQITNYSVPEIVYNLAIMQYFEVQQH